jgi:hypothetical protein
MPEPMKVYVGSFDSKAYEIQLPSGKKICLGYNKPPYVTEDPVELEFFSRQRGLYLAKLTDAEFRTYYSTLLDRLPAIGTSVSPADVEEFVWKDAWEAKILEELKARGWTVYRKNAKEKK